MISYETSHDNIRLIHGPASEHVCGCGAQAKDWAYQHTAGEAELRDEAGLPYSANPDNYAAMCRSCHVRLDGTMKKVSAAHVELLKTDPAYRQHCRRVAALGGAAVAARRAADPEFDQRLRRSDALGGAAAASMRRRCNSCDMVSHPAGIGNHQKSSGHVGWEPVAEVAQ